LALAKEGYCGGNPEKIANLRVDWVVNMLHYGKYINDYEKEFYELNKDHK